MNKELFIKSLCDRINEFEAVYGFDKDVSEFSCLENHKAVSYGRYRELIEMHRLIKHNLYFGDEAKAKEFVRTWEEWNDKQD